MANQHRVQMELRNFELPKLKSAVKITILNGTGKVCEVEIGRGGLIYTPKGKHPGKSGIRYSWEKLAEILENQS